MDAGLERDVFSSNRHLALVDWWRMDLFRKSVSAFRDPARDSSCGRGLTGKQGPHVTTGACIGDEWTHERRGGGATPRPSDLEDCGDRRRDHPGRAAR